MAQGLSDLLVTGASSGTGFGSLVAQAQQRAAERARDAAADVVDGARRSGTSDPVPRPAPPRPLPGASRPPAPGLPASRNDLDAVARASAANQRDAYEVLDAQARQIQALQRTQAELAGRMDALQQQCDRMLLGLFEGLSGLERKVETAAVRAQAAATQARAASTVAARQAKELQTLEVSSNLDKVSAVVNTVQSAAFGQSGSALAPNNLALAANQLFWSFLEPLLKGFGIVSGPAPSVVTWLAPLGTLLTGQLVLGDRQHVRFLSGTATFDGKTVVSESLHDRVAPGFRGELERRQLGVTLTPLTLTGSTFRGFVRNGTLSITRTMGGELASSKVQVGWVVDLGPDIG